MNIYNLNSKKESFLNYLIIFSVLSFIFFSGLKYEYFQIRYVILILFCISICKFYYELKKKNFVSLKLFLFLFLFLTCYLFLNLNNKNFIFNFYVLYGYIFFYIIFIVSYFYTLEINKRLDKTLLLFYFVLIISSIIGILLLDQPKEQIFCGGVPVYYIPFDNIREIYFPDGLIEKDLSKIRFTFNEFLFNENSHLGMIAPGCIIYSIYQIFKKKTNIWFNLLFFLFVIICILKNSTTLMIGTICSLIFLLLFNYKYFSKYLILIFTMILFIFSSTIYFSSECNTRLIPLYYDNKLTLEEVNNIKSAKDPSTTKTSNKRIFGENIPEEILVSVGVKKKYAYIISDFFSKDKKNLSGSLSSAIYFNSLSIAFKSIIDKPLGWGINGYENAFKFYKSNSLNKINIKSYNTKDASNNFAKIVVEFGVFGIMFYLFLVFINFSKTIPIEYKLIYIPIIITQSIRGAGYFNGGFILIVFLLLFSYINFYKKHR